jgi:vacuolar-type H+-ATPase subunit F/Vma7
VNLIVAPNADASVAQDVLFKSVGVSEVTETEETQNPDGSRTFIYTEAYMAPAVAKSLAEKHPDYPIVLISHGHADNYEERIALIFHGKLGRLEVATMTSGDSDMILAAAENEDDLLLSPTRSKQI